MGLSSPGSRGVCVCVCVCACVHECLCVSIVVCASACVYIPSGKKWVRVWLAPVCMHIPFSFFGFYNSKGTLVPFRRQEVSIREHTVHMHCAHALTQPHARICPHPITSPPHAHMTWQMDHPCFDHLTLAGFLQRHFWSENPLPNQQTDHPCSPRSAPQQLDPQPCYLPPLH